MHITIKKCYVLGGESKKKTTEIFMAPEPYSNMVRRGLVEYSNGLEPSEDDKRHGNAKTLKRPYQKRSRKTHENIKLGIKMGKSNAQILEENRNPQVPQFSSQVSIHLA